MDKESLDTSQLHECHDCRNFCQHYIRSNGSYKPIQYFHCLETKKKDFKLCEKYEKIDIDKRNLSLKEKIVNLIERANKLMDLFE